MDSLQVLTIKNIIKNISDNEQILSLIKYLQETYIENINAKYKEHYWSLEDGKFNDRLESSLFHLSEGTYFDVEEQNIRYRFYPPGGYCLYIRDLELHKFWRFKGTWNGFKVKGHYDNPNRGNIENVPQNILDYALFLWKYKP